MPTPTRNRRNTGITLEEVFETVVPTPAVTVQTFVCAETGQTCPISEKVTVTKQGDQIDICRAALGNYILCNDCNEYFHKDDEHYTVGENIVCEYCFNDEYFICEECGGYFRNDQYGNDGQCRSCGTRNAFDTIQEYGAKAPLNFMGKKVTGNKLEGEIGNFKIKKKQDLTTYIGCEIEVECGDDNANTVAKEVRKILGEYIITKRDGSLSNGFEIVTVPATVDVHKEKLGEFFDKRPKSLRAWDTTTCGLHFHVSRKSLTSLQIGKIIVFVNSIKNRSLVETIAGREMGRYCIRKDKTLKDVLPKYRSGERHEAVNLTNRDTVEFRFFRGTLYKNSFWKNLEFVQSLIDFCGCANRSIKECISFVQFLDFIEKNKTAYPHLYSYICVKWHDKEWISNDGKTKLNEKYGFKLTESEKD